MRLGSCVMGICISFLWLLLRITTNLVASNDTYYLTFLKVRIQNGSLWAKIRVLACLRSSWRLQEKVCYLPFPAFRGLLHSFSSIVKATDITPSNLSLPDFLASLSQDPVITLSSGEQCRIIFPSQNLNLVTFVKSLLPCKVTFSQVLVIKIWISLGEPFFSDYHSIY